MKLLREEKTAQILFILFGFAFVLYFVIAEWDGLIVFANLVLDGLASFPDFVEKIYTYFKAVPHREFQRSLIAGGIFGAITTAIIYLAAQNWLQLPKPATPALSVGFLAGALAYYLDTGFWNAIRIGIVVIVSVAYFYQESFRQFFTLNTLTRLLNRRALTALAIGIGLGAVVGAVGAQILMYPLKHCAFEAERSRLEYRLGLVVTAFSALVLLIPTWTLLNRRTPRRSTDTVGYFPSKWVPYTLLLPTLLFLVVFLYYPAVKIFTQSATRVLRRPRGASIVRDYCLQNYLDLSENPIYRNSFSTTLWMTVAIVVITMIIALGIAVLASQKVKGANLYRTFLIWPYAVSPLVMGAIFLNLFRKGDSGLINWAVSNIVSAINYALLPFALFFNDFFGLQLDWLASIHFTEPNWLADVTYAPWVIIMAAVWNALGFNILFYIAGLQSVPPDLLEAAAIDGANRFQRFFRITFPLLSPFSFFLLVANVTYSFYGIYGIIDVLTQGGPFLQSGEGGGATDVLIYSAYREAFTSSADIGVASTQAVVLFILVAAITLIQFRYIERQVTYGG